MLFNTVLKCKLISICKNFIKQAYMINKRSNIHTTNIQANIFLQSSNVNSKSFTFDIQCNKSSNCKSQISSLKALPILRTTMTNDNLKMLYDKSSNSNIILKQTSSTLATKPASFACQQNHLSKKNDELLLLCDKAYSPHATHDSPTTTQSIRTPYNVKNNDSTMVMAAISPFVLEPQAIETRIIKAVGSDYRIHMKNKRKRSNDHRNTHLNTNEKNILKSPRGRKSLKDEYWVKDNKGTSILLSLHNDQNCDNAISNLKDFTSSAVSDTKLICLRKEKNDTIASNVNNLNTNIHIGTCDVFDGHGTVTNNDSATGILDIIKKRHKFSYDTFHRIPSKITYSYISKSSSLKVRLLLQIIQDEFPHINLNVKKLQKENITKEDAVDLHISNECTLFSFLSCRSMLEVIDTNGGREFVYYDNAIFETLVNQYVSKHNVSAIKKNNVKAFLRYLDSSTSTSSLK